jgi:hypothetical protein
MLETIPTVLVVGSGVGANLLVDFVDALYDVGRIFESPMMVEDKQFKFPPMSFPTKSPSLSKRTYEQWQKWFEEGIESQKIAA